MKRLLTVLLTFVVALSAFAAGSTESGGETEAAATIKNPDTVVYATIGDMDSLDPAKAYDNASWGNMQNIMETLVAFEGGSTLNFLPVLATEVPTYDNGGISPDGKTIKFKIRKGVKFHNGNDLTPEDVEYSFERNMVLDPDHGPGWFWFFSFNGNYSSRLGDDELVPFDVIDNAVEVDGDYVVFNLASPYPPFVSALCGKWASIIDKEFTIAQGGWPGTAETYPEYNNPDTGAETLYETANGTGPYKLVRWDKGIEVVVERNEEYWGQKPALKRGIYKVVEEWSTRKLMLLQGDADFAFIPAMYYEEMKQEPGLTVEEDLPDLGATCAFFNQNITVEENGSIFSGKLDGQGIPADFFSDINVRYAFTYAWDRTTFIDEVTDGNGVDPVTPIIYGLAHKDESIESLPYDLAKAGEYFKKAWGGQVWEKGFKMELLYNTGNVTREVGAKLLAENVGKVNPKFVIEVRGMEWPAYLDARRNARLPINITGWGADYPDPDNFAMPFMHSQGDFAGPAGYSNPEADKLIEAGALETDPAKRSEIYSKLQQIWVDDAPGIMTHQPVVKRIYRDWVKGYVYHPMESEHVFYTLSKE